MDCLICLEFERSNVSHPAIPLGGTLNDLFFICPCCESHWVKVNVYSHLWQRKTEATYQRWLEEGRKVFSCSY